jgi:prepilin-type processing-associated H-X9-DG protein
MSLKDWEETGGKPQAAPEQPTGRVNVDTTRTEFGTGPRFYRKSQFDPVTRRRLLEMVGVVIIIFSVMYVMIPVYSGTAESSRRTICATHLQRLVQAAKMYEADHDGLPPTENWTYSLYHYILDRRGLDALFCPSESNLPRLKRVRETNTTSYTYFSPAERQTTGDETTTAIFWDRMGGIGRAAHPGGGNVAYQDGHISWLSAQHWTAGDLP